MTAENAQGGKPHNGGGERVATGVPGLDDLIEGGLPAGRVCAVVGPTGAGKTTLGLQFLHFGITGHSESGVLIAPAAHIADLYHDMARYGWDLAAAVDAGTLAIIEVPLNFEIGDDPPSWLIEEIRDTVRRTGARRVVCDCLEIFELAATDELNLPHLILRLCGLLRELQCTSLIVGASYDELHSFEGLESLALQGIIKLHVAHNHRAVEIRKMAGTRHDTNVHRLRFTDHGITVAPGEHPFN